MGFYQYSFVSQNRSDPVLEECHPRGGSRMTLGASDWSVFRRVIFRLVASAYAGIALSFSQFRG